MSDFFIPKTNENDYWTQKKKDLEEKQKTAQINNDDYWKQKAEPVIQQKKEHYENWNRYGVDVPDEYYEVFNKMIPKNGTPEEAQEEAYRIGSAYKYMQMMGCSFEEAYKNVDAWNEAQFTDLQGQKPRYEALSDMITMGNNNVKLGRLGQQLMQAHLNNDKELADALMAQIDAINQRNVLLQDNTPRKWFMEMLEAGAQSLPFTGYIAGAGLIGNFIAPAVGTGAAFAASSYLSAGQEYIDMLANGATPQTARIIATVSGGIQGLIEANLGLTKGIVKGAAKTMGKEVSEDFARKTLEKIGQKVFKRFHFGAGKKLLLNYLAEYGMNVLGEGVEEFLQEITSIASQEIAASIDGYDIPDDDFKSIVSQTTEAFRGGILGALALGFVPAGLNTKASVKNYRSIKEAAETVESPEVFYEEVKENPVFGDMTENTKKNVSRQIWEEAQARKEESYELEAKKIAEGRDVAEGAEESPEENEDETTESNPVARNEAGRLITQNEVFTDDDGNTTGGTFVVGDTSKNKEEGNRYGYIKYTADEKGDITITDFKMTESREGLRAEVFEEFAREHPDVNIEWNAIGSNMQEAKQALIEANPSGAKNGLNYYTSKDLDDIQTKKDLGRFIRESFHNIKAIKYFDENNQAKIRLEKTELTSAQIASAVALFDTMAQKHKVSLTDFVNNYFVEGVFGSNEDFANAVDAFNQTYKDKTVNIKDVTGSFKWKKIGQQLKAIIYAGENADYLTLMHELAHFYQETLTGDLKAEAEAAFDVHDGDWEALSTFKDADGNFMSKREAFAYSFQDWIQTGRVKNNSWKNVFEKFAQFLAQAYTRLKQHLNLTPEIESVFEKMLDGDDTIMSKALKAAQEEEGEYRATLKRQSEEKEAQKKAEAEEAKRQAQAEREEASEGTDFEENAPTAEDLLNGIEEAENETTEENNAIDDALENLNLADDKKAEIADVLKDENSTRVAKAEAMTEAASSVYDENVIPDDLFFQTMKNQAEQTEAEQQIEYVRQQYEGTDQWMKASNGQPTNLTENQWLQVRTPNFKRWFGNWELGIKDFNVVETEQAAFNNKADAMTWAEKNIVGLMTNEETGGKGEINISNKSVDEMLNLNQRGKSSSNVVHYAALTKLREIIHDSEIVDAHPDFGKDENGKRTPLAGINKDVNIDVLYGALRFKGDIYRVKTTIKRFIDKNANAKAYAYDVQKIEVLPGIADNSNNATVSKGNTSITGDILLRGVRKVNQKTGGDGELALDDYSKVLDENGEPLVVYHGTDADFTVFDASKSRANMDIQGNFFSPWDIDAQGYGPNVRAFYLNVRNPANSSQGYSALNTYKGQNGAGIKARELLKSKGYDGVNNDNEEYITFEPNQIKSATDNNGNFDANNPDMLFQIAGEIGAENLDNSEVQEGVTRMQNLVIAKQMETDGKDAKVIRLATGWEKGADGKWRWEIDDSKFETDFLYKAYNFRKEYPRYNELEKKLNDNNYDWEKLTTAEQTEFDELGDIFSEGYYKKEAKLSDILDAKELYTAYPQLKNVPVKFTETDYNKGYEGQMRHGVEYFEFDDNTYEKLPYYEIEINTLPNDYNTEKIRSTLLHEVQHIIQYIEGFAKGGDLNRAAEIIESNNEKKQTEKNKALAWEWKKELEQTEQQHPELRGTTKLMDALIDEYIEDGYDIKRLEEEGWIPEEDIRIKGFNLYARGYDNEGYEDAYNKWSKDISKYRPESITDMSKVRTYKRFAGEVESRNVQTRINFTPEERREALLSATEDVARDDQIMLFQTVYHGSGADFDKFDTENFGLSGEGSMSFGYGTYVTDNEEIARSYAERQRKQFKKDADNPYERDSLEYEMFEDLRGFDFDKERYKEYLLKESENIKKDKDNPYQDFKADNKLALLDNIDSTNLYIVEIPDNGYLDWKENLSKDEIKKIVSQLKDFYDSIGFEYRPEQLAQVLNVDDWYSYDGRAVYETLEIVSKGQRKIASQFLHSIGYAGIKYPAGTIHGNGNGAYNYVIFNDEDAKIVDHLLFQTQAELADEARGFDSWQEFMEYCETFHADDEVSPIPGEADAQWYQSFWEIAHGVETEQEKNEKAVKDKYEKEDTIAGALDAYFATEVKSNPEILDNFLNEVARIDAIDLESDEWQRVENAEDATERDNIDRLKDFINITLSDYNWQTALKRIQGGHEIAEGLRKRLVGEMTDSFKTRDFRALYAEVMNDQQYAVSEEDSITATLNKKLKKYHDIVKPTDDISRWSPEKRKQLAEQLQNREIAAKIKNGSLKLDDELDAYIKSLTKQIREKQKQFDELEAETKTDYQRIADAESRQLLKLHDELLIARGKVTSKDSDINRKIAKGLKITEKYRLESQNLTANYDELFRKFNDLKNSIRITAEVQAALERQEQLAGLKEDLNSKQKEKNLTAEIKKMRIQLVKRTMRRVPFSRIDYNSAKTVIAIQRLLEPNLLGGVNRFIGINSPYLRGVISQIVTDSDYKEKIMNYLSRNSKSSQAFMDFKKKLSELKSIKDFDSWTAKDRKAAIRYLPKENWVRDLNLKELAKEREESIDLDIGMEEYSRTVYDEKTGEPKTYKDKDGNDHNVTETAFRLQYKEELGQLVKDAVGADMFDKIINMPFSEWTTEDLEQLAQRIDEIYTEGRTLKAAKDEARRKAADAIRKRIEDAIKETGITINDDDTPEEKERKQKQIDKILGMSSDLKGTEAGKTKGFKAKLNRLLHSYSDMNLMRFARMLDNQSEGENYRMLYRMEDDCYNTKQRSMNARAEKIYKVMKDNKITEGDLAKTIKVDNIGTEFTVDELLYFLAADKDYAEDEKKVAAGFMGLDANDDYAATSRNAVMFGNMMSDMASQEEKERWVQLDKQMEEAIKNDTLSTEQKQLLTIGQLDRKPGTSAYIATCHAKWLACLSAANSFIAEHPEYKALMEAIEEDYASQYERMNEVSINEFNMPVHRVKAYVPLVRRESNGDTNVNQVKEDLLGAYGAESGKQWVNKGMTQRRVSMNPLNQKPVQTGLFTTWGSSIERTEHFIAYSPYVRQLNAVYKSRDAAYTRRFIEARYGKSALEYLDSYINEVANPNAGRIRERGAEWLHVLRGKTAPAYLGWKASAIVKQGLTSPWPYMQFVNPAEYLSAAMKFTFNPQMREAIKEKSVFMKMRRMDPVNDLIDEMADNAKTKLDRGWSKFSQIGMQGLEMIDWACVAPGWLACYEKKYNQLQNASEARYKVKMEELKERNMYADVGTSEYLSPQQMEAEARKEMTEDIETEAVRYADDCTRACQPSNRVTDLAPLFKNSSEAMKAFLQFQTSLNVIWQNIRYDMPYAVKQKEFKRIAGTIIGYVMAGIFMNSVMDGIGGDDDDDETQALKNLIYYSTTQFTDAIPIMGSEITNTMDQLITGKRGYASSGTDMTPSATKLLSVLTNAKKGNWTKAAELTAEGIGLYLGAPVSGAKEIYKLLGKPLDEGDVNLLRGISDVYGLADDIIE